MPERERKQKPAPKERVEETAEVAAPAKQGGEVIEVGPGEAAAAAVRIADLLAAAKVI